MEILVTVTIFILVFGVIAGLFASALKAQRRALAYQELLAQTSYAMEYMSRQLRMATVEPSFFPGCCMPTVNCIEEGDTFKLSSVHNGGMLFRNKDGDCMGFVLRDGVLYKADPVPPAADPDDPDLVSLTSDKLVVEDFKINLIGEDGDDSTQPRITIFMTVRGAGEKDESQPVIKLQNTISTRNLDAQN